MHLMSENPFIPKSHKPISRMTVAGSEVSIIVEHSISIWMDSESAPSIYFFYL